MAIMGDIFAILAVAGCICLSRSESASGSETEKQRALLEFTVFIESPDSTPPNPSGIVHICGGVLLSRRHVLTAAHCVANETSKLRLSPNNFVITAGLQGLTDSTTAIKAKRVAIYPNYIGRAGYLVNDIALITLLEPFPGERVQPVSLPEPVKISKEQVIPAPGQMLLAVGWGRRNAAGDEAASRHLKRVELNVISPAECGQRTFECQPVVMPDTKLCTESAVGAIQLGDSGGPLINYTPMGDVILHGIGSYIKESNCPAEFPEGSINVYTRVSQYLPWIRHLLRS